MRTPYKPTKTWHMRKMVEHTYIRPGSLDDASQYLYDMKSHKPKTQNSNLARQEKQSCVGIYWLSVQSLVQDRQISRSTWMGCHSMNLASGHRHQKCSSDCRNKEFWRGGATVWYHCGRLLPEHVGGVIDIELCQGDNCKACKQSC